MRLWRRGQGSKQRSIAAVVNLVSVEVGIRFHFHRSLPLSDEEPEIELPAIAKALLEPFRRIIGMSNGGAQQPQQVQLTFVPPQDRPTDDQLAAIGRVATTWSVVERMLGITLTRLSMTPEFPGMAITKDLGLDAQVKAIRTLMALHSTRYQEQIVGPEWLKVLDGMLKDFTKLRLKRNEAVHTVWFQSGESLASLRPRPVTEQTSIISPAPTTNAAELVALAEEIQKLADAMFVVTQYLPAVDEAQHAESLALRAPPPLPTTAEQQQSPSPPSPE